MIPCSYPALFLCIAPALVAAQSPATRPDAGPASAPMDRGLVIASVRYTLAESVVRATKGRTDAATINEEQDYARERSDETLAVLADMGVTMVCYPVCGYGPDLFEEPEWTLAADFARRIRAHGMAVGVWLPLGMVRAPRWAAASQSVGDWLIRDADGRPPMYRIEGLNHVNRTTPAHQRRTERIARRVMEQLRPDAVFLPEFLFGAGHEPAGVDAFRAWMRQRMTDPAAAARFTSVDPAAVLPPRADSTNWPLVEEWQRFRADVLARDAAALKRLVGSSTHVGVESPIEARRPALDLGPCMNAATVAGPADMIWSSATVQCEPRGRVRHQIAELKAFGDAGCRLILPGTTLLDVAQSMAFGRDAATCVASFPMGQIAADADARQPLKIATVNLARYLTQRREFFRDTRRIADVVLLQPDAFDPAHIDADQPLFAQAEGALVSHRVLFTESLDPELSLLRPDQVLVLAGAARLTDAQIARIRRHVAAAGPLVIVGQAGTRDANGQPRNEKLLDLLASPAAAASAPADTPRGIQCRTIGRARVALLQRPDPLENCWLSTGLPRVTTIAGADPYDDDFSRALRWAAGGRLRAEIRLHGAGVFELTRSADDRLLILHVVNYDPRRPEDPAECRLVLPPSRKAVAVTRHVPAAAEHAAVEYRQTGDLVTFRIHACEVYDLYAVELAPRP